jgi:lysylphosphatidylglycerol synthetase-like protein (DUF2156 family)
VAAGLYGVVILFQLALIAGAPWGDLTQGGADPGALSPASRVTAGVSAVLLAAMALGLLARAGVGPLAKAPRSVVTVLARLATVYAGIGLVLNLITPSAAERALWAPVTAVILVCAVLTMGNTRGPRERAVLEG